MAEARKETRDGREMAAPAVCERICRRLEAGDALGEGREADGAWEREMEALCACIQAAEDGVFRCWVRSNKFTRYGGFWMSCKGKAMHFAARFGSRAVLQAACGRTAASLAEAAQMRTSEGSLVVHLAVANQHLSASELQWVFSWDSAAASAADQRGNLPLHLLMSKHESLTTGLVDALVEVYPAAVRTANQGGDLPLHYACCNPHLSPAVLRHVASLHRAAASTANQEGELPLHVLVSEHTSLSAELVDVLVAAHPAAVQTANQTGDLPLHYACYNPHMTPSVLRHVASLYPAAASTADQDGDLPLHRLVHWHESLSAELVEVLLKAHPAALQTANGAGSLPLHCACGNAVLQAESIEALLPPYIEAAVAVNNDGMLPYQCLVSEAEGMEDDVRSYIARLLMEATDVLFPPTDGLAPLARGGPSQAAAEPTSSAEHVHMTTREADTVYALPPPDPRWSARPHPLSSQGRLKVGLHVAIRGRESAWQFQTGGLPTRKAMDTMTLSEVVEAGHGSLLRERLARPGAADLGGVREAVLRALEHGHDGVVRILLQCAGYFLTLGPRDAVCWLGALMRHWERDHDWLMRWIRGKSNVLGDSGTNWLCLEAAACSGQLSLVQTAAATVQAREGTPVSHERREQLAERAVASGSVAALRWLQSAGLATRPPADGMDALGAELAKHDRLAMLEVLHLERGGWWPGGRVAAAAAEHGAIRMLRWLHVHTCLVMDSSDMAVAVRGGHATVVQFLHRHHNITHVADDVLNEAVRRSSPGTLAVVEYVLQHGLCPGSVTGELVVSACTARNVRVCVGRYLVSRASEAVLCDAEADMRGGGSDAGGMGVLAWLRSETVGTEPVAGARRTDSLDVADHHDQSLGRV